MFAQEAKPQLGQLDASPALFTVLAAINAAGYDAGMDSPSNHWLRKAVRDEIAKRNPKVVAEIRDFMRQHRQEDANWELRQYISFGLLVEGPPNFEFRLRDQLLPPDVAAMSGLIPLLIRFHKEAGIDELWQKSQPAFDEAIGKYHQGATRAITDVSGYLRVPLGVGYMGRRFQVFVDLLGAPNQIHLRSFLDDYFLVLTHSPEPQFDQIRTAYLHFLLDPLATKYAEAIEKNRGLTDYAQGAPFLADHYKDDFLLLSTKCLVLAIEARLAPGGVAAREALVREAMSQGYVMTAHFYEQLPLYEKQEQAMRLYFPDLIKSIDLRREAQRLERLEFSRTAPVRKVKAPPPPPPPTLSASEKALEDAEVRYRENDFDKARELFARVVGGDRREALAGKSILWFGADRGQEPGPGAGREAV